MVLVITGDLIKTSMYQICGPTGKISGQIKLDGSKSISNRVLIIRALCEDDFKVENLSGSDDTQVLSKALAQESNTYDVGHAGTSYRFLTAYLSMQEGTQELTGSHRMLERPIGPLVDALKSIGANINYLGKEGYPPLSIQSPSKHLKTKVSLSASVSSQYLTALLLIAPSLPEGLTITLEGEVVSRPYIEMTISLMESFGVSVEWKENVIKVRPQAYQARDIFVESDWSAASYYYAIASIADQDVSLTLHGLSEESLQGDSAIADITKAFGVKTVYHQQSITLTNQHTELQKQMVEYDFLKVPDIAQTVFSICAAKNIPGLFTGLQTLKIKETDRIKAFQVELEKIGVFLTKVPNRFLSSQDEHYMLDGNCTIAEHATFDTYHDHRMAMALSPLSLLQCIRINDPMVVTKSYPHFYDDLSSLGFEVVELTKNV